MIKCIDIINWRTGLCLYFFTAVSPSIILIILTSTMDVVQKWVNLSTNTVIITSLLLLVYTHRVRFLVQMPELVIQIVSWGNMAYAHMVGLVWQGGSCSDKWGGQDVLADGSRMIVVVLLVLIEWDHLAEHLFSDLIYRCELEWSDCDLNIA